MLEILRKDPWLKPYRKIIEARHDYAASRERALCGDGRLADFADGHLYYGLHRTDEEWVFREWAPNACEIFLIGDFSDWQESGDFRLKRLNDFGDWEVRVPLDRIFHGQHYKMRVKWNGGQGDRIPAWCRRVVQDHNTAIFCAQVWEPEQQYRFRNRRCHRKDSPLMIYECHIGMAQEREGVGTYVEFTRNVLPRIKADGYNCIQIMAVQEHPYYGSFGYHVSNFFAPSSRFGTPEELKELIDTAHGMGITVIMDLVHSHSVKNEYEGLGNLAGDVNQYFLPGDRHEHSAWGSLCFDYGKDAVVHFLLSNCKYWMEEFQFDGFRFDGVTSMIYYSHGLGETFCNYDDYFNGHQDGDAICYLMLANKLIHQISTKAITIAEEVSGMPGIAAPFSSGGIGFDYRMAMNIPDYWIKTIKELRDEEWNVCDILWQLTNRRSEEKTISYVESHDQALVGDKTVIFRLVDADMYWHFQKGTGNLVTSRGIALHKLIRLVTMATINGGYLNFMGNEFGHPEWIDFPREGNGWSYKYARRQWSLVDNHELMYHYLGDFDESIVHLIESTPGFHRTPVVEVWHHESDQVLAFSRGDLLFVINFNPSRSFFGYGLLVPAGSYSILLDTDNPAFGGAGIVDDSQLHLTEPDELYSKENKENRENKEWLRLYLPARTAFALKRND